MTNKTEAQIFADDRPSSLDDDLYQWSLDAEIMLRAQAYRIAQLEAELIQQTNRAASAEQQVTALNRRLDDANAMGNEARHKLAQLSQAQAVPDGWKLVPAEPTEEMVAAAEEAHMPFGDMQIAILLAISAAPPPPELEPLTDEQIEAAIHRAVKSGALSWTGFKKDDFGAYTVPVLSPADYQAARAIEAALGIKGEEDAD